LRTLVFQPASVNVGQTVNGVVTLTAAAPASGVQVSLASSAPAVAQIPQSVTVPSGQLSIGFAGTANAAGQTTVTATSGGTQTTAVLTVTAVKSVDKLSDKLSDKPGDKLADKLSDKVQTIEKASDKTAPIEKLPEA
jgi:hypothetical protein